MAGGERFATLTIVLYLLSSLFLGSLNQEDHYTVGSLRFVLICIHRVFLDPPCLILYTILWLRVIQRLSEERPYSLPCLIPSRTPIAA